jgi:hypothetical protein
MRAQLSCRERGPPGVRELCAMQRVISPSRRCLEGAHPMMNNLFAICSTVLAFGLCLGFAPTRRFHGRSWVPIPIRTQARPKRSKH